MIETPPYSSCYSALYYYSKYCAPTNYKYQLPWIHKVREFYQINTPILNVDELVDAIIIEIAERNPRIIQDTELILFLKMILDKNEYDMVNNLLNSLSISCEYNNQMSKRSMISDHHWFKKNHIIWLSERTYDESTYYSDDNIDQYYSNLVHYGLADKINKLVKQEESNQSMILKSIAAHEYYSGKNIPRDIEKSADLYYKLAQSGGSITKEMIQAMDESENPRIKESLVQILINEARESDIFCIYTLGKKYHRGIDTCKDNETAAFWLRKAVKLNSANASTELFDTLWEIGTPEAYSEMIQVATDFAAKGDGGAMGRLGRAYRDGKGVNKDLEIAAEWFRKASATGLGWTKNSLFDTLWEIGTPEAYSEMIQVATDFAAKGDGGAMGRLGRAYRDGKGVNKDLEIAAEWYDAAINNNVKWAITEKKKMLLGV